MKKILSGITSFLLVGVLVGGVCACGYASRDKSGKWFGNSDFKSWHWSDNTDDKQSDDDKADNKPVETFTAIIARSITASAYAANQYAHKQKRGYSA